MKRMVIGGFSLLILVDGLLFYGGYSGRLSALSLWLVKPVLEISLLIMLAICTARYLKQQRYGLSCGMVLLAALTCLHFFYTTGYHEPFFNGATLRLRRDLDPAELQQWATRILRENEASNEVYIPGKEMPSFLKLPGWRSPGGLVITKYGYVQIAWGSGVAGMYGIAVGTTGYVRRGAVLWKPGIYFFKNG